MSALFGLGGSGKTAATQPQRANGLQFNASDYGKPLPLVYGRARVPGIVIWYGDFKANETKQQTGKGGGGGSITSYTYSFSFALAFAEGPITGIRSMWINSAKVTAQPDVVRLGTAAQASWSHWGADALTGPALAYPNTAWAAWLNWNAGSSPSTPQVNFEIDGLLQFNSGGGIYGAEPSAIITDLFANSVRGSNWPWLGDLSQYHDYCVANSLFLSPVYDTETTLSDILTQLLQITNTEPVWSGGALKLLPRSDDATTANGAVYTPVSDIVADLGPDDFQGPVQIDRKPDGDLYNVVRLEWTNAAANYVTSVVTAKDLAHIARHGEQAMATIQAHEITDPVIAAQVAQTILQQQLHTRNIFTFEVDLEKIGLESMDKITLTDPLAELDHEPVRIVDIEESGDLAFQIIAEEFPAGVAQGAAYALEAHAGFSPDHDAVPDTTAEPVFFRAPSGMAGVAGTPAVWAGAAGSGPNWGGANVWASFDDASFSLIGTVHPGARYGLLKTALAAGADPDVANSCELNLIGPGQLTGGSNGDADNGITLILIDQELIAYSATTLNGDGSYTIGGNYLRRGMYGTAIAAHAAGAPWLRVDDNFFSWSFAHDDVGKTIYLKFQAFNLYGGGTEDLATAPTYSYVLGSAEEVPDVPPVPADPQVLSVADGVSIKWTNSNPAAVAKTQVQVSPDGAAWSELEQTASEISTHHFTDGQTYYYRLRARSAAFVWSAYTATISSTGKIVESGATAGATIGPGGNVGGEVNGDGRPAIDFSWGGHFNNNVDYVYNGATFGRPLLSYLNSGKPITDFAGGYNLHQNADYIPAGSTWGPIRLASLTGGNVDLALTAVQGRHLGNIGDATGRYAVVNGAGFKGVSLVDGSNRAGVDFTNGINLGQNLDNMADGSSFARINKAYTNGSKPVFDLSDTFHRHKTLDYMGDGSTYLRMPGANMDSNRRAIADFTNGLNLGQNLANIADGGIFARSVRTGANLIPDSNFLLGSSYWTLRTASVVASSDGGNALRVPYNSAALNSSVIPAKSSTQYTLSATVDQAPLNASGTTFFLQVNSFDAAMNLLAQHYVPFDIHGNAGSGTNATGGNVNSYSSYSGRLYITFTTSSSAAFMQLISPQMSGTGVAGYALFSAPQLEAGSTPTAYQANTPGNISLDNLNDGSGRFAIINGAGFKGVSLVDGSNRAGVDFASGVNLHQNADYIAETATNKWLGNNKVATAHLQNASADVNKLAPNAATKVAANYDDTGTTDGTDGLSFNLVKTVTLTTRGGPTSINVSGVATGTVASFQYLVKRDGSNLEPASLIPVPISGQANRFNVYHSESPPAGSHTYTFYISKRISGDSATTIDHCSIHVLENTN